MSIQTTYPGIYIEEVAAEPTRIEGVPTDVAAFVGAFGAGPIGRAREIRSRRELDGVYGSSGGATQALLAARLFFENGGRRSSVVRARSGAAADLVAALEALDGAEHVGLLSVPDTTALPDAEATAVVVASRRWCERRRAFLLVDPPQRDGDRDGAAGIAHWLTARPDLRGSDAGIYVPRLVTSEGGDPSTSSGAVAGVYARTDRERGVWKAPAGTEADLREVAGPTRVLDAREIETLTPLGVNAIRVVEGRPVVWGARTLADADEWTYVNVRRLLLFLERSIDRGTSWAVFEPNDEPLWARLRALVEAFLQELFRAGAFAGSAPDEAYFVRCGRDTMTRDDIDQGILHLEIGVAPLRPAEFVVFRISHRTARPQAPRPDLQALAARIRDALAEGRGVTVQVEGDDAPARTAAASTLARELGRTLYRVDLTEVVNRYIGETEKNLDALFERAAEREAILLLDEADTLFGERSGVQDPQDRSTGKAIAQVLRRIEAHPGIVALAVTSAPRQRRRTRRLRLVLAVE